MILSYSDIAARIERVIKPLANYKSGDDRGLRIFAEDALKALLLDVRETAQAEAATAPAPASAGEDAEPKPDEHRGRRGAPVPVPSLPGER